MSSDRDDRKAAPPPIRAEAHPIEPGTDEPPVVARLIVEIRSDGSRTIARGAVEDAIEGVRVGLKAEGATPMELAATLARSMLELPVVRTADQVLGGFRRRVRALLPGRK